MTTPYATDRRTMCRHRPVALGVIATEISLVVLGVLLAVVLGARRVTGRG